MIFFEIREIEVGTFQGILHTNHNLICRIEKNNHMNEWKPSFFNLSLHRLWLTKCHTYITIPHPSINFCDIFKYEHIKRSPYEQVAFFQCKPAIVLAITPHPYTIDHTLLLLTTPFVINRATPVSKTLSHNSSFLY